LYFIVSPKQNHETLSGKVTNTERVGSVAQEVEHLPSKCGDLSSNPTITKKIKFTSPCDWWCSFQAAVFLGHPVTLGTGSIQNYTNSTYIRN
jgi:hypothetical protein